MRIHHCLLMLSVACVHVCFYFTCTLVQEVSQETAHHSLMADDQHIALSL